MVCPKCGYFMDELDTECARCRGAAPMPPGAFVATPDGMTAYAITASLPRTGPPTMVGLAGLGGFVLGALGGFVPGAIAIGLAFAGWGADGRASAWGGGIGAVILASLMAWWIADWRAKGWRGLTSRRQILTGLGLAVSAIGIGLGFVLLMYLLWLPVIISSQAWAWP